MSKQYKLSDIVEILADSWIAAEDTTGQPPTKKFRLQLFTEIERRLHESGVAPCDFPRCAMHPLQAGDLEGNR